MVPPAFVNSTALTFAPACVNISYLSFLGRHVNRMQPHGVAPMGVSFSRAHVRIPFLFQTPPSSSHRELATMPQGAGGVASQQSDLPARPAKPQQHQEDQDHEEGDQAHQGPKSQGGPLQGRKAPQDRDGRGPQGRRVKKTDNNTRKRGEVKDVEAKPPGVSTKSPRGPPLNNSIQAGNAAINELLAHLTKIIKDMTAPPPQKRKSGVVNKKKRPNLSPSPGHGVMESDPLRGVSRRGCS